MKKNKKNKNKNHASEEARVKSEVVKVESEDVNREGVCPRDPEKKSEEVAEAEVEAQDGRKGRGLKMALLVMAIVICSGAVWYPVFRFTPMRGLFAEKAESAEREEYIRVLHRLDSLTEAAELNSKYLNNITRLLSDSIEIPDDDSTQIAQFYNLPVDSIKGPSKAESEFVKKVRVKK